MQCKTDFSMKKFTYLFILFSLMLTTGFAQVYNNEWIDYSKTYYKFKVAANGLYRINAASLNAIGLANEPVQNFKLWRNGKQVALYTSVASGPVGAGYIEFWGEQNDGVLDNQLYRQAHWQLSDKVSLQTDTAAYFLTVDAPANNLRFSNTSNNVSGNVAPAEPHFMHTVSHFFKDRIHRGTALNFGEYVYSSSYDVGEMWASPDITPQIAPSANCAGSAGIALTINFNNLSVATAGPAAIFKAGVAGSAFNQRNAKIDINGSVVVDTLISLFDAFVATNGNVPLSTINNNASVRIGSYLPGGTCIATDRIVASFFELTYPRTFNFGGQANFTFTIPASATNKYVEITNFNGGTATPVLYDLTNNRRYVAEVSGGVIKVALQPSVTDAKLVLVSQEVNNVLPVTNFTSRTFVDYTQSSNQGDYLIISHPSLHAPANGVDQVEQYKTYRTSAAGGNFNAKVYDVDQIVDQFAFGIKKHPLSIKNFLKVARNRFATAPKFVLLLGKGLTYADYRENQSSPRAEELNLIPTWGYPASDVLLASDNMQPIMSTPIGRLSVVRPTEIADYLNKVKQYEAAQQNQNQTIENKAWMKSVVHVAGGNDPSLDVRLSQYFSGYERVIEDTLFGGIVTNFNKVTTGPVTPIVSAQMDQAFQKGISLLTYFGHSSASSLDYNLNNPQEYNNTGKYPMFVVNGCNAGNLYQFDVSRLSQLSNLSEIWVLAKDKGSIGFIASTHFGVENYLNVYTNGLYRSIGVTGYGKSIAYNISEGTQYLLSQQGNNDNAARLHAEQTTLHGDPAIKINSFPLPDYVIEEPQIVINPTIVSAADTTFNLKAYIYNIAKAPGSDSLTVQITRQYPNGTAGIILNKKIRRVRFVDSLEITVPIIATRDKGENKITVSVDTDNRYSELSETNNSATKTFIIFEDELMPVYPYNYSIVNKTNIKLAASTADPLASSRTYLMEIDTTENFNSSLKVARSITAVGGLFEFDPGINFADSTVYYWRVAPAPATGLPRWNSSSFVYLAGTNSGFNQSHYYQHTKSGMDRIYLDPADRRWKFRNRETSLTIRHTIFPVSNEDNDYSISINGEVITASACVGNSIIFNVFDPVTMKPYFNQATPATTQNGAGGGFMKSGPVCLDTRKFNFEYSYLTDTSRRNMRDFLDWIPSGSYVTARLVYDGDQANFASAWKNDALVYGAGNTLYDRLKNAGFADIDSFSRSRTFAFVYKKNDVSFAPVSRFTAGATDRIALDLVLQSPDTMGIITSPRFGPATSWKQVKWRGSSLESNGDNPIVNVIGITASGVENVLHALNSTQQDFDVTSVNASQYPYLRLSMVNTDAINFTPYQLRYWRVFYTPVPEGALATTINYTSKDTLEVGEALNFSIAFKNVSDVAFADSIRTKVIVSDRNNVARTIPVVAKKFIAPGEVATINFSVDTKDLAGINTLYVDVNPNNNQPEQTHSNNFLYKNFFVKSDTYNPLMDVTFDGVHILNGDIVSAKPQILIKLKDESKFLALDDTSLVSVFVRYPGSGQLRRFAFNTDTLRFVPADLTAGKNEAMIEFTPSFLQDSDNDFYELVVRAKDKSGNNAGNTEYTVRFQVINKAMITNTFNYPNPFTTSTAFVFTITGSEVPQNIRIQILTITGKIVRDITKEELGPLHIGRNITEFKWDGTDQYGQSLANGIYLYRVLTNHNGSSLEKYRTIDENGRQINTDQYFNKGYGKMYLMR